MNVSTCCVSNQCHRFQRRYYLDKPWHLQLLPYLLTHYPKKFTVNNGKNTVDFLEVYSKDVSSKR
jgi:hypothetical protein